MRWLSRLLLGGWLLCAWSVRPALAIDPPDLEIAKRHYAEGLAAYDGRDYARALREFEAARALHSVPELTYNIARCLDRLERRPEAAREYQAYLVAQPYSPSAAEVRERVEVLAHRDGRAVATVKVEPPSRRRRYIAPIAVGVTALALAALGGGLIGGAAHEYDQALSSCAPGCNAEQTAGFLRLSGAAYASFAMAGAAALVDVGLIIAAARHHE